MSSRCMDPRVGHPDRIQIHGRCLGSRDVWTQELGMRIGFKLLGMAFAWAQEGMQIGFKRLGRQMTGLKRACS